MQVSCPLCQSSFPGSSGNTQTCPACMHSFELEQGNRLPPMMALEVQGPLGEALGCFDVMALKQKIYAGELSGREVIRIPGEDWEPIYERPELTKLFELVGVDLVAIRLSSQRIQGWRKDASAQKAKKAANRKKVQKEQSIQKVVETPEKSGIDPKLWLAIAAGVALVALLFSRLG